MRLILIINIIAMFVFSDLGLAESVKSSPIPRATATFEPMSQIDPTVGGTDSPEQKEMQEPKTFQTFWGAILTILGVDQGDTQPKPQE